MWLLLLGTASHPLVIVSHIRMKFWHSHWVIVQWVRVVICSIIHLMQITTLTHCKITPILNVIVILPLLDWYCWFCIVILNSDWLRAPASFSDSAVTKCFMHCLISFKDSDKIPTNQMTLIFLIVDIFGSLNMQIDFFSCESFVLQITNLKPVQAGTF